MTVLTSRVISIHKRKTTMRLCTHEWEALKDICKRENISRKNLFELIEKNKDPHLGLTPSIRLFSLVYFHDLADKSIRRINKPNEEYGTIFRILEKIA